MQVALFLFLTADIRIQQAIAGTEHGGLLAHDRDFAFNRILEGEKIKNEKMLLQFASFLFCQVSVSHLALIKPTGLFAGIC